MTTWSAPGDASSRTNRANAPPTSETNASSISSPTSPRTSYALMTRLTAAAGRDIDLLAQGLLSPAYRLGLGHAGGSHRADFNLRGGSVGGIWQHPQVPAPAGVRVRTGHGRSHQR